jgi:hypothetical protein
MAGDLCEKGRPMGRGDGVGAAAIVFFGVEAAGAFEAVAMLSLLSHAPQTLLQRWIMHKGFRDDQLSAAPPSCNFQAAFSLAPCKRLYNAGSTAKSRGGNTSEMMPRNGVHLRSRANCALYYLLHQ